MCKFWANSSFPLGMVPSMISIWWTQLVGWTGNLTFCCRQQRKFRCWYNWSKRRSQIKLMKKIANVLLLSSPQAKTRRHSYTNTGNWQVVIWNIKWIEEYLAIPWCICFLHRGYPLIRNPNPINKILLYSRYFTWKGFARSEARGPCCLWQTVVWQTVSRWF